MLIRPGYQNLFLVYDLPRFELDELFMSLRTVFQKVARDKVRYPEIHTRQTMNDQMRLIYSAGRGVGGWRIRVGFERVRPPMSTPLLVGYLIELIPRSKNTVKFR